MRSVFLGIFLVTAVSATGQTPKPKAPSAPDSHPDLQGTWDFAQLTPFERPSALAGKSAFSDEEAEEFAQQRIETSNKDDRSGGAAADVERAYNDFWWDFGKRVAKQTSLVVDPADGRVPALTPAAQARNAARRGKYDNPEERPLAERCVVGFNSGPPMIPSAYNNNMQLVQTKDTVLILNEMIHSARLVALNGRPHPPAHIRSLTGDSIGHWEGDTLVFRGASKDLHLVERFSRVDANTLKYEFTVDDPATWTAKWSASIPMTKTDELIYEYACHESNYGMVGVLKGARYEDQQKVKSQK
jgi:hypothetical protein